ncbi:IS orf [Escherichia coli]|nr:IS orf [Escherichia coli]
MIPLPSGTQKFGWLPVSPIMRNGFNGPAAKVQTALKDDPMSGHVFIFRGRSGSQVKLLWSTGDGLVPPDQTAGAWALRLAVSP